jgi:hypothetical protein
VLGCGKDVCGRGEASLVSPLHPFILWVKNSNFKK